MAMSRLSSVVQSLTLGTSAGASTAIDMAHWAGGGIIIPIGETYVTLTFYVSDSLTGTYVQLFDDAGIAVSRTVVANQARPLPPEVYGYAALKIVANAAGTAHVTLKG